MNTVSFRDEKLDLEALIYVASKEPVLILTTDGNEFVLAVADDFDREAEALRASPAFQRFLDERSRPGRRIPLEDVEAEIERELNPQNDTS
jgi:PHD/YefM family antitoxin component YafN of YafNO toxin-antitoxin module